MAVRLRPSARLQAAQLLGRVLRDGAFSNVLLNQLDSDADARLVRRLVYGTLRHLPEIDYNLAAISSRDLEEVDAGILDLLRVGGFELLMGEGAPHAAVNEAVEGARSVAGQGAAGFTNAVLRKLTGGPIPVPPGDEGAALELGVPVWILRSLAQAWGETEARAFLQASQQPAQLTARVRPGASAPGGEEVLGIPGAFELSEVGSGVEIMDPSSVAVGLAADVSPGLVVADLAAAPGGKTLHLYDLMEGKGKLIALDRHPRRATSARRRLARSDVHIPWLVADARRPPLSEGMFDRVLLDAPCTGLGTLRRRPEIRHRLTAVQPSEAGRRQREMIEAALSLLKPDGLIVYSVCTVFPEETTQAIAGFAATAPEGLPGRREGEGWLLAPHLTRSDGMFISLIATGR